MKVKAAVSFAIPCQGFPDYFFNSPKAAIRYLRHNKGVIPGNTERIVTNGTSAGGALSSLAGATGNAPEYEPYLEAIGAARERDDIFAASCYCPIHNLENADAAYEWQFHGEDTFHRTKHARDENGNITRVPFSGDLTEEQKKVSADLSRLFPAYLNSLGLTDEKGLPLTLDAEGNGSFRDHVLSHLERSIRKETATLDNETHRRGLMTPGSEIGLQDYFTLEGEKVTSFDWTRFVRKTTRMKAPPAFDALDLSSPENEEFGDEQVDGRHFTAYSQAHSKKEGSETAKEEILYLMNPIPHIQRGTDTLCRHWRIRHGSFDRDTSLAIPTILATVLRQQGVSVDFALPWGLPHSGDYDLPELFAWIDQAVAEADKKDKT